MSEFEPLSKALEGWFEARIEDLPGPLRQRVAKEFFPFQWGQLAPSQRRSVAEQCDAQNDPGLEPERQYWWDQVVQISELEQDIARWEVVHAPTSRDLAVKESKLVELRRRLKRLEEQYGKGKGPPPAARRAGPRSQGFDTRSSVGGGAAYVAYPTALRVLRDRLEATPEELAAWVYAGPEEGGLAAYVNANELDPPPRFYFPTGDPARAGSDHDYMAPLMAIWFRPEDLASFVPRDRYLSGRALIERWSEVPGIDVPAYIRAKIAESRLIDAHPIYGGTRGTFPQETDFPPLELGLFTLAEIEAVETEDFGSTKKKAEAQEPASQETPSERNARITKRVDHLRSSRVKGFIKQAAKEFGLSEGRIKQIVYPKKKRAQPRSPASWTDPVSTQARSSPPKRKG